jgi:predicted DCC family thiol-disulfide oxidoreductase YuxK
MHALIILYDRDCGFCTWSLAKLLAWDRRGRLYPVALQDPEADRLLAGMDAECRMASWHLVEPGGRVCSAGAAIAPLISRLPGGAPIGALARAFPRVVERGYRWVAGHRSLFGRLLHSLAGARAVERAEGRIAARGAKAAPPARVPGHV